MKALPLLCTIGTLVLATVAGCQTLFAPAGDNPITTPPSTTSSPASPTPSAEETVVEVIVEDVVDGDTIRAHVDGHAERIRLLGIDTPEVSHDGQPAEECGEEAKHFLTGWIEGSTVTLSSDPNSPERDRYDRLLAYVDYDDVDVGYVMLDEAWAELFNGNDKILRWDDYQDAFADRTKPRCAAASAAG